MAAWLRVVAFVTLGGSMSGLYSFDKGSIRAKGSIRVLNN